MHGTRIPAERQKNDEEDVLPRILRRTYLDPPGAGLAVVRAPLPDQLAQRAVLVVVLVVDEELEPATADRVDHRIPGQQDLAVEHAAAVPGPFLWRYGNAEATRSYGRLLDRMQ